MHSSMMFTKVCFLVLIGFVAAENPDTCAASPGGCAAKTEDDDSFPGLHLLQTKTIVEKKRMEKDTVDKSVSLMPRRSTDADKAISSGDASTDAISSGTHAISSCDGCVYKPHKKAQTCEVLEGLACCMDATYHSDTNTCITNGVAEDATDQASGYNLPAAVKNGEFPPLGQAISSGDASTDAIPSGTHAISSCDGCVYKPHKKTQTCEVLEGPDCCMDATYQSDNTCITNGVAEDATDQDDDSNTGEAEEDEEEGEEEEEDFKPKPQMDEANDIGEADKRKEIEAKVKAAQAQREEADKFCGDESKVEDQYCKPGDTTAFENKRHKFPKMPTAFSCQRKYIGGDASSPFDTLKRCTDTTKATCKGVCVAVLKA